MTQAMFPYAVWQSGTNQNSIPANDNSLRSEVIARAALAVANAAPGSPSDGDVYIVGVPWGVFSENDVVIFRGGNWYGFAPFRGWLKYVSGAGDDGELYYFNNDSQWVPFTGAGTTAASAVTYDNTASGISATNVQAAIDELAAAEGSTVTGAINVGVGGFGPYLGITPEGVLRFRNLIEGDGIDISYDQGSDVIKISALGGGSSLGSNVSALSIVSGAVNVDCSLGDYFTLVLTASVTSLTFSNLPPVGKGRSIAIRIRQDGTGSRTLALPSSFKAIAGSDTAVQTAANAYTVLMASTFDAGSRWEYSMRGVTA